MDEANGPIYSQTPEPEQTHEVISSETHLKPSKKKQKLLIIAAVTLIIIAIAAFMLLKPKKTQAPTGNPASGQASESATETSSGPLTVAYALSGKDFSSLDLYWSPPDADKPTEAKKLGSNIIISQSAVRDDQIAIATESTGSDASGPTVWYSSDAGKTYTKIFEDDKKKSTTDELGTQITSLIFASDGKSVIVGYLPTAGNNVIKQINVDGAYAVTNLLTAKTRGVFLQGYNVATKRLFYFEGCYNCDGNNSDKLIMTDLGTKASKTFIDGKGAPVQVAMSKDGKEILVLHGTLDPKLDVPDVLDGQYNGPPYILAKVETATGDEKSVANFGTKGTLKTDGSVDAVFVSQIGYMKDGKTPFYTANNQLYTLKGDKPAVAFESSKNILRAYYVSDDLIYVSTGDFGKHTLTRYDVKSKEAKTLLSGTDQTNILGIPSK